MLRNDYQILCFGPLCNDLNNNTLDYIQIYGYPVLYKFMVILGDTPYYHTPFYIGVEVVQVVALL